MPSRAEGSARRLVRFAKRTTAWENIESVEKLQQIEFQDRETGGPDLRPSLFEIPRDSLVRACAEFSALREPRNPAAIECDGLDQGRSVRTPGRMPFAFTRDAHRELPMADAADLLAFVGALAKEISERLELVPLATVEEYVAKRLGHGDEEWSALAQDPAAKKWISRIARKLSK